MAGEEATPPTIAYDQMYVPVVAFKQYKLSSWLPTYTRPFITAGVRRAGPWIVVGR